MTDDDSPIEDIIEKIGNQLEECADLLLSCELEKKVCKKCKNKADCLFFIRSVLAALCKIEAERMFIDNEKVPEGMYL